MFLLELQYFASVLHVRSFREGVIGIQTCWQLFRHKVISDELLRRSKYMLEMLEEG